MSRSSFIRKLAYFDGDKYLLQAFADESDKSINPIILEIQKNINNLQLLNRFLPDNKALFYKKNSETAIEEDSFFGKQTQTAINVYNLYLKNKGKKTIPLNNYSEINKSIKESISEEKVAKEAAKEAQPVADLVGKATPKFNPPLTMDPGGVLESRIKNI
jgi:hypothetical protein